ncbi:MAG: hypothetical protein R3F37_12260 [Candidatus Competibacteraceae bacterium]
MKLGKLGSLLSRKKNADTLSVADTPETPVQPMELQEAPEITEQTPLEPTVAVEGETVQAEQDTQGIDYNSNETTEQKSTMEDDDERIIIADFSKAQLASSEQRLMEFTRHLSRAFTGRLFPR